MKKLGRLLLTIIIICAIIYLAPKLVHKCDDCEKWFVGTGYDANVIVDAVSEDELTICKDCAEQQHLFGTTFGKSLDDYKKKLFE